MSRETRHGPPSGEQRFDPLHRAGGSTATAVSPASQEPRTRSSRHARMVWRAGEDCELAFNVTQHRGRVGVEGVFLLPSGPRRWIARLRTAWQVLWHRRLAADVWLTSDEARSLGDRLEDMADVASLAEHVNGPIA